MVDVVVSTVESTSSVVEYDGCGSVADINKRDAAAAVMAVRRDIELCLLLFNSGDIAFVADPSLIEASVTVPLVDMPNDSPPLLCAEKVRQFVDRSRP